MAQPQPEIGLRPWRRLRDRSAIERWPAPQLPAHWLDSEPATGPRFSYAIDLGGQLVGRLSLRDISAASARLGIYLHPEYYGRGIGTAAITMLCAMMQTLEGVLFEDVVIPRTIHLDVAEDNHRAIRCYQKCGFFTYARTTRNGITYLEMVKNIAPSRAIHHGVVSGPVH